MFASDIDEDEDELPAVQTVNTQPRTRKLAGTKQGREENEGVSGRRTKRSVLATATPSLIQTRAGARREEIVEPAPASEGENDTSGEECEDAEEEQEAVETPKKRQAPDDEEKGSRKAQPKRKISTRGRKIVAPATASEAENSGSDVEEPKKFESDSEEEEEVKAAKKKPRATTTTRRGSPSYSCR